MSRNASAGAHSTLQLLPTSVTCQPLAISIPIVTSCLWLVLRWVVTRGWGFPSRICFTVTSSVWAPVLCCNTRRSALMHRSWIAWRNGGSKQLMIVFNQKKAAEWQSLAKRKQISDDIGIIPSTPSVPIFCQACSLVSHFMASASHNEVGKIGLIAPGFIKFATTNAIWKYTPWAYVDLRRSFIHHFWTYAHMYPSATPTNSSLMPFQAWLHLLEDSSNLFQWSIAVDKVLSGMGI